MQMKPSLERIAKPCKSYASRFYMIEGMEINWKFRRHIIEFSPLYQSLQEDEHFQACMEDVEARRIERMKK